jgi:hypothetical protein
VNIDLGKSLPSWESVIFSLILSAVVLIFFPKLRESVGDVPFWVAVFPVFCCILTAFNLIGYVSDVGKGKMEIDVDERPLPQNSPVKFGLSDALDSKMLKHIADGVKEQYAKNVPNPASVQFESRVRDFEGVKVGEFVFSDDRYFYTRAYVSLMGTKLVNVMCSIDIKDREDFDQAECDKELRKQFIAESSGLPLIVHHG